MNKNAHTIVLILLLFLFLSAPYLSMWLAIPAGQIRIGAIVGVLILFSFKLFGTLPTPAITEARGGIVAPAKVLQVEDLLSTIRGQYYLVKLTVEISPQEEPPFTTTFTTHIPRTSSMQVNDMITVIFDPQNHDKVALKPVTISNPTTMQKAKAKVQSIEDKGLSKEAIYHRFLIEVTVFPENAASFHSTIYTIQDENFTLAIGAEVEVSFDPKDRSTVDLA